MVTTDKSYDRAERLKFNGDLQAVEKLPLADRKANAKEFAEVTTTDQHEAAKTNMERTTMIVTRKVIETPSNSKSPGSSHHIDISGVRFLATAEQRGTGFASAEIAEGEQTINLSASFFTGKAKRLERRSATVKVIVTGDQSDSVTITVELAQRYTVQFLGVREAK